MDGARSEGYSGAHVGRWCGNGAQGRPAVAGEHVFRVMTIQACAWCLTVCSPDVFVLLMQASGRDYDRDRRGGRDSDRSRGGRDYDRGGRDYDRDRDRGRSYDDRDRDRGRDSRRSRSRSRSRGRDTRDVFKEAAPRDGRREDDLRDRYGNGSGRR